MINTTSPSDFCQKKLRASREKYRDKSLYLPRKNLTNFFAIRAKNICRVFVRANRYKSFFSCTAISKGKLLILYARSVCVCFNMLHGIANKVFVYFRAKCEKLSFCVFLRAKRERANRRGSYPFLIHLQSAPAVETTGSYVLKSSTGNKHCSTTSIIFLNSSPKLQYICILLGGGWNITNPHYMTLYEFVLYYIEFQTTPIPNFLVYKMLAVTMFVAFFSS